MGRRIWRLYPRCGILLLHEQECEDVDDEEEDDDEYDGYIDDDYSGGGGGGGYPSNPPQIGSPIANSILRSISTKYSLSNDALEELLDKIDELNEQCLYKYMFNSIAGNKKFSNISVNTSMSAYGAYNASTGTLTFQSEAKIDEYFPEEFIHLYQDWKYPGGILQYANKTGEVNIEFEAKFLQDILCVLRDGVCPQFGVPEDSSNAYVSAYTEWLLDLHDMPSLSSAVIMTHKYNGKGYSDFLENFKNNHPTHNTPIDVTLTPKVVSDIFDNAVCP
jgi:hypothetical protein